MREGEREREKRERAAGERGSTMAHCAPDPTPSIHLPSSSSSPSSHTVAVTPPPVTRLFAQDGVSNKGSSNPAETPAAASAAAPGTAPRSAAGAAAGAGPQPFVRRVRQGSQPERSMRNIFGCICDPFGTFGNRNGEEEPEQDTKCVACLLPPWAPLTPLAPRPPWPPGLLASRAEPNASHPFSPRFCAV